MNTEQIEHELVQIKDKTIFLIVPLVGDSSMSVAGTLQVVTTEEHSVGFHLDTFMPLAIIFYADDVQLLEGSKSQNVAMTVRLKKRA